MIRSFAPILACLVLFHSPDGVELAINTLQIIAMRPIGAGMTEHVAKGTATVIYVDGKAFGVRETPLEALELVIHCKQEMPQQ